MAFNVVWFWYIGTQRGENHMKIFEVIPKMICVGTNAYSKSCLKLFRQVWGNSGKNILHPQKFACFYTYA